MSASSHVRRTGAHRRLVIEKAVRFIRKRIDLHRMQFALEVGKHLFENVYMGDLNHYRRTGNKDDSIEKIAADPGVKPSANKLRMCIHLYLLTRRHAAQAPRVELPDLHVWAWDGLWDLEGDPESLVIVAAWAARHKIRIGLVRAVAKLVEPYLEEGGKLDDLLVGDPGERKVDTPYRRIKRMGSVLTRWISRGPPLSPEGRSKALDLVEQIERTL